ncbi:MULTISPECIES: NAD(P)/FAD-dependent oxidoreductase [Luteimonas]|uniref:NAD(P)/FAD-dependent oxidoreductase n=1 Tax=Luteimonas TaxID=83614 RepID=UPI000C7C2FDE|nr:MULTISPECIES: NAD(P)/FAD-dependent oxidoreductase [Luteimonas]
MAACDWDVVIVGASFAGAACALAAREAGLRVCVLERKHDPGIRLHTTGIIVAEAFATTRLGRMPAHLYRPVPRVRLYAPRLASLPLQADDHAFLTTDTPNVLRWLAGEMRDAGVDLRLMQSFTDAARVGDGWQVQGLGSSRWLIGADGAKSRVAQRAGLGQVDAFLYGIEHEFAGATLDEPEALHCFISRALAPGYIGWAAQSPTGVQFGLAFRHRAHRRGVPDIDTLRARVGARLGLPADRQPDATRAGLIPCGGPVARLAAPGVILTGDAAGIVSPLTAGGIHSAWAHGWTVGEAIGRHRRGLGDAPERVAERAAPRFRSKRLLRWAFDRLQMDWPVDALLHSPLLRRAAEQVYFHRRGRLP